MNKKPIIIILLIISMFLCVSAVSATNSTQYYVDSGVDVSGDGSQNAPFKTIEEAINVVDESKTTEIYINGSGNYKLKNTLTLNYNHNQTSLSFIGLNNPTLDTSTAMFKVSNANSNIVFSNFTFTSLGGTKQILSQSGGNTVTFDGCTFKNIAAPSDNKGLFTGEDSYLYFKNSKFLNFKSNYPVIVLNNFQHVSMSNCEVNSVGRVIYSTINNAKKGGSVDIHDSRFSNCYYPIKLTVNIVNITNSQFTDTNGNVIYHDAKADNFKRNTEIYIDNSKFISNVYDVSRDAENEFDNAPTGWGDHNGGAIYSQAKVLNVTNSLFKDNMVTQGSGDLYMTLKGAGIYAFNINCINTTFDGNKLIGGTLNGGCTKDGAAIYSTDNANVYNSTFINNHVDIENGGAIYCEYKLNVYGSLFSNNTQPKGYSSITFLGNSNINDNIFLDLGNNVVANKTDKYNVDYNWWNTNERPNFIANNWIILDLESESDSLVNGSPAVFTLAFKNVKYVNGTVCEYNSTLSDRLLKAVFDTGIIQESGNSSYEVKSVKADFTYIPEGQIGDVVTLKVFSDDNIILTKEYVISEPYLNIQTEDIFVGENAIVNVNIHSSRQNGTVTLKIDGKTYTNKSNNNKAIFNISGLESGFHEIMAEFDGMQATSNITVTKLNTTASIKINGEIGAGNDIVLEIALDSDATGTIEINVNGVDDLIPVNYGTATYNINSLLPVDYVINITYSGDGKYNPVKNSTMFHVVKAPISLNVTADNIRVDEDLIVKVAFNESDVDGNVTILLNGVEKGTANILYGAGRLYIGNLDAGNYTISAIYDGGIKYLATQANSTVSVGKQNSTFDISVSQNKDNTIKLVVDINATGNVTFVVGNVEKTVDIVNNQAILDNVKLNNANYVAEVTYNGDKNYYPSVSEYTFTIKNKKLVIKYYVDGMVSKSGDGSRTNPFKTINEAVNHVVDNYTIEIYILPDEYSIDSKITLDYDNKGKETTLTFLGWGGDTPIINSAVGSSAVNTFRIGQNSTVYFENIQFVEPGDRFFNLDSGDLTFTDCIFEKAKNDVFKSTIYVSGGNLTLNSVDIQDCDYSGASGGFMHIASKSANVLINDSKFSYNTGRDASVIYTQGTGQNVVINVTILNSLFKGNNNALLLGSVTTIDNCTFENNLGKSIIFSSKISNFGDNNDLYITNSKFSGNTAAHAVESAGNLLYIENSTFTNNINGNGLVYAHRSSQDSSQFIVAPKVYVYDSLFEHNDVGNGAIYSYVGIENVSSSRFVENTGLKGAAIFNYGNLTVYNSTFEKNNITSDKDGAAIYVERGNEVNINYSSFKNNKALGVNNAITIMSVSGNTVINNNAFYDNDGYDVYNKGISEINADSNWWGSNDNPNLNINVSNWVILTASSTPNFNNTTVNANFNYLKTIDNETVPYNSSIPDREVRFASDDGEFEDGYYGGFVFTGVDGDTIFTPDEGNFTIDVFVDDKYITTINGTLKIKTLPEISIDVNDTLIGDSAVIIITVGNATGNVTVNVANYTETVELNNSIAQLTIPGLSVGDYEVSAIYNGDDDYLTTNGTANFSVLKLDTPIDLSFDGERLIIKLLNDTTGSVTIDAKVRNYTSKLNKGQAIVDITSLGDGNFTLIASYPGDGRYNPVNGLIDVEVKVNKSKTSPEILIDVDDTNVGNPVNVVVTVVNATGNVTITVGDYENTVVLANSVAHISISDLPAGDYKVTVLYNGDDNYLVDDKTASFSVLKLNSTMDVSFDDEKITVKLPKDATGVVTVTANDTVLSSNITYGQAIVDVSSLDSGKYTISVDYAGDDNYDPINKSLSIEIEPKIILKAYDLIKYFKSADRFKVTLNDTNGNVLANKQLIVNINGKDYTRSTDSDGIMTMAINLDAGNYSVTVTYDDNGTSITSNATIQVISTISGNDVTKMFRNGTQYYATFVDSNGNPLPEGTEVTFNINGVMYKRMTNASGTARLNINLINGTYIITAINPSNDEMSSNTIKVLANIVENKDITMYFRNGTRYTVRIVGSDGKVVGAGEKVTFNINGVMYTRETDANGYAGLNINLNPGTYIITAIYNDCMVSNTIKVLPTLVASDLTKKYGVASPFRVTVLDGRGNKLAGVSVSFNINGVFYERTSNAEGIASLNINLMAGKYIVTSSYNNCAISNTVTVEA
ncbi:MAG: hypothetical protein E7Z74_04405 [Methanobrevibacter millerae]|uniref:Adhesin-like protein n=1 Tax=Methanobrevibacter millerae TaxID=230361 RepID=A0A8T3VH10_9EURY|nr:hypothetical protein [Methanobrevibacter millerae]